MSQLPLQKHTFARDLARQVTGRGLRPIALLTLEAGRPLAILTAQFLWLAQPVLSLAWQPQQVAQWAQFLEEPGSIDTLIGYLESEE